MVRLFNQYFPARKILFFTGECIFIALAVIFSLTYHNKLNFYLQQPLILALKTFIIVAVYQASLFFSDFYTTGTTWTYRKIILRLFGSLVLAFCIVPAIYALTPLTLFDLQILTTIVFLALLFLIPWRIFYNWFISSIKFKKRVLVLGSGKLAKDIVREIISDRDLSLNVIGFISQDPKLKGVSLVNPKVIGDVNDFPEIVAKEKVDKIIVAMEERRGNLPIDELLKYKACGIDIEDGTSFYEKITNKLLVEYLNPSQLIFCKGFELSFFNMFIKRAYDIILSVASLIIASPLLLLIALVIKCGSKGPVFFKQKRVGKDEKHFYIYKFRSMQHDAERHTGPIMTFKGDARITRVGKILRKTRLDELPQLLNVLKGDMSFVGPRPERPVFVAKFKKLIPFYGQRFTIRPGITGWAQIKYNYAANIEQSLNKLSYELYYLKNFSLLFDFSIILRTIKVVLYARGS